MKNVNLKHAALSAAIIWTLGVTSFVASYYFPVMSNLDEQANWVLSIALIPVAAFGAYLYYRKGHKTNGFALGAFMFLIAMVLDALITVPFLIMPYGGNHITFFTDQGFWLIAAEYVGVVVMYWQVGRMMSRVGSVVG